MAPKKVADISDMERFRPDVKENDKVRVARFFDLCKSCGLCVEKCPVKCISWEPEELGMLGEPVINIDMDKCIGCEQCEQICPDFAIEITNKKVEAVLAAREAEQEKREQ